MKSFLTFVSILVLNKFFTAARVTDTVNTVRSTAWFLVQMQMSYSCWGVALQQLHFPAPKTPGVMAKHKSSLCKGPLAQPVIGPLIKLSTKAAFSQTSGRACAMLALSLGQKHVNTGLCLKVNQHPVIIRHLISFLITGKTNVICKKSILSV